MAMNALDWLRDGTFDPNRDLAQQQTYLGNLGNPQNSQGFDFDLGKIMQGAQLALNAFNAFQGYKALGLAQDQFNFQKDAWKADYANNIQAYNTSLADILGARAAMETGNRNSYDNLIAQRSLKERNIG